MPPPSHRCAHCPPDRHALPLSVAHAQRRRDCPGQTHHLKPQEDFHGFPTRVLPSSLINERYLPFTIVYLRLHFRVYNYVYQLY